MKGWRRRGSRAQRREQALLEERARWARERAADLAFARASWHAYTDKERMTDDAR